MSSDITGERIGLGICFFVIVGGAILINEGRKIGSNRPGTTAAPGETSASMKKKKSEYIGGGAVMIIVGIILGFYAIKQTDKSRRHFAQCKFVKNVQTFHK